MEVFQNLHIYITDKRKDIFLIELKEEIKKSNWQLRDDLIDNYRKNTFASDKRILCVESESYKLEDKEIKGLVWLWDYNKYFEVFNIVPVNSVSLSHKEYNFILHKFYVNFLKNLSEIYNAEVVISKPIKLIEDTIGFLAYGALQLFSNNANKNTGNSNHYDFRRWCDFIFIIFRNKIKLASDELEKWLVENGWDDDMALKLSLEFEYSLNLLENYESN